MCAVEWKKLGDVCKIMNGKDYKSLNDGNIPVYGSGGIMTYVDTFVYNRPSVLLPRKGSLNNVFYVDKPFWTVDTIYWTNINEGIITPKYFFYYMDMQDLEKLNVASGAVPSLTQTILNKINIPIPSLAKQQEIVSHLDTFTTLISNLESELDMRRKQYEHYRNQLLDFEGVEGVEWKTIEDIAEIGTGSSNTKDELDNGLYPFFVRSQQVRWQNKYEYDETAIITSGDGVGVGKIFHYIEGKYALHQRAYRIHILDTSVVAKYVYNYMKCKFYDYIMMNAYSSSVTSVRRPMLLNFEVPIPSSKAQQEIVEKLDAFENLIKSLEQEIKLRKQQYEYYREKLLTFE